MTTALQMSGLLSALIFVISAIFEVVISNNLYVSQHGLIAVLLVVLAVWAWLEVLQFNRQASNPPLRSLGNLLGIQIGLISARHWQHLSFKNSVHSDLTAPLGNSVGGEMMAFLLITLVLYLAITNCVIQAFSLRERERANQLQERNVQLLQMQEQLAASQEEQQRMELQQRTQLEQKLKTSLTAAAVAHEIQQPLSAILLNCRSAHHWLNGQPAGRDLEPLLASLNQLSSDGDRVVATMERMRMLLRNVETKHAEIDLVSHLNNGLLFLKNELAQAQVQLQLEGLDQPCYLNGDGSQLQIATINLIRNSLQAMEAQAPQSRRLLIELHRSGSRLELEVADSGPGFPEGFSNDLSWELLKSTKASGMGIGLFIAQTAATNHRGQLHIRRSGNYGGAAVVMELPLPVVQHSPADGPSRRGSAL